MNLQCWRRASCNRGWKEGTAGSECDSNGPLSAGVFRLKLACLCDLQHSYRHKHNHMTGRDVSVQRCEAKVIRANRKTTLQIDGLLWFIRCQVTEAE